MNKFESIIERFLTEGDLQLTPAVIANTQKGLKTAPSNVQDALKSIAGAIDPQNANPLHKKLSDILDPSTKTSIKDLSDEESKQAIDILTKAGFPISLKKEEDVKTSQPNTKNSTTNTNPTNQTSSTIYKV